MLTVLIALSLSLPAQTSTPVPISLLEAAAHPEPMVLAHILADARIPGGIEIHAEDANPRRGRQPSETYRTRTREQLDAEPTVPLVDVIARFNQSHASYRANIDDGVVVIRTVTAPVRYLDAPAAFGVIHARGLWSLSEKIYAPLSSSLDNAGGRAASVLGPAGRTIDRGENLELTLDGRGRRVIDVLNELARHAPGQVWAVVTSSGDTPAIERFGFLFEGETAAWMEIQRAP